MKQDKTTYQLLEKEIQKLQSELKVTQSELSKCQSELKEGNRYFNLITDVFWKIDVDKKWFSYVSKAIYKLVGYTPEEFLSVPVAVILPPPMQQKMNHMIHDRLAASKKLEELKYCPDLFEMIHKNGSTVWVEIVSLPYNNEVTGKPEIIGTTRDVTQRILKEKELNLMEHLINDAASLAQLGSWEYSVDKQELNVSTEWLNICGLTKEQYNGSLEQILKIVHPDDIDTTKDFIYKSLTQKETSSITIKFIRSDQQIRYVTIIGKAILNKKGELVRLYGYVQDITEQSLSQQKLEASEKNMRHQNQLLQTMISNFPGGILVENSGRKVMNVNGKFCELFEIPIQPSQMIGFDCEEAAQQTKEKFVDPEQFILGIEERLTNKQVVLNEELRLKDGRFFQRDYVPVIADQKVLANMWVYRDITEGRQIENELRTIQMHYTDFINVSKEVIAYWQTPEGTNINLPKKRQIEKIKHSVCIDANHAAATLAGKNNKSEIVGKKAYELFQIDQMEEIIDQFIENDYTLIEYENNVYDSNGELRITLASWSGFVEENELKYIWITSRNVTEQKKAERILKESEEKYRSVVAAINEGIILRNEKGEIIDCNQRAVEILGLGVEQIIGNNLKEGGLKTFKKDGSPFPTEQFPAFVSLKTRKTQQNVVMGILKPNGDLTWIMINSAPILRNNTHAQMQVVSTFSDVTENIDNEHELIRINERFHILENILHYEAQTNNALLDFALNEIIAYTSCTFGLIYHYNSANNLLLLNNLVDKAHLTFRKDQESMLSIDPMDCLNMAIESGQAVIINEPSANYPFIKNQSGGYAEYKSLTIPIIIRNEVVALFWLASIDRDFSNFDAQQVSLLLEATWVLVERQRYEDKLLSHGNSI